MNSQDITKYSHLEDTEKRSEEASASLLGSESSDAEAYDGRSRWLSSHGKRVFGFRDILKRCTLGAGLAGVILLSFLVGWSLGPEYNDLCIDTAWKDLKKNVRYGPQTFNPRFEGPPSPYMGEPNPQLDRLWYDLSKMFNYGVDHNTLVQMNRTHAAVQWPGTNRYQVGLEAFHQLHCLNYVRMYTYQSYYEKFDYDMVAETPEERTEHKNHCVEVLRQSLMCAPDLNVYSYHWIGHRTYPYAELHTPHQKCIDWDAFYAWQRTVTVHSAVVEKPEGAEVLFE